FYKFLPCEVMIPGKQVSMAFNHKFTFDEQFLKVLPHIENILLSDFNRDSSMLATGSLENFFTRLPQLDKLEIRSFYWLSTAFNSKVLETLCSHQLSKLTTLTINTYSTFDHESLETVLLRLDSVTSLHIVYRYTSVVTEYFPKLFQRADIIKSLKKLNTF